MKKFCIKILILLLMIATILGVFYYSMYKIGGNDLPAAYFSNSLSFNEKIEFLHDQDLNNVELIAVGSSMTLNNINSKVIVDDHGYQNYLNLASWGFKITDTEEFLKNMLPYFPNLKRIIISTNLMDLSDLSRNIHVDYDKIRFFLNSDFGWILQYVPFNLKYVFNNARKNKSRHLTRNTYQSLEYDDFGGVVLNIDQNNILDERWEKDISQYEISNNEVKHLKLLSDLLDKKGIELTVSFSPIRKGMLNEDKKEKIYKQIEQIKRDLSKSKIKVIEPYSNHEWADSLFVDFSHLNKKGTEIYTKFIFDSLE